MLPQALRGGRPDARAECERDGGEDTRGCIRELPSAEKEREHGGGRDKRGRELGHVEYIVRPRDPAGAEPSSFKGQCQNASHHRITRHQVPLDIVDKVGLGIVIGNVATILVEVEIAPGQEARRNQRGRNHILAWNGMEKRSNEGVKHEWDCVDEKSEEENEQARATRGVHRGYYNTA